MKLEKITARGAEHLYRHPKTGVIYYRQFKKGRGEITKSTRRKNLIEAKAVAEEITREFFGSDYRPKLKNTALEEFDDWIERKRLANKAPATITSMLASRKYLKIFFHDMLPSDITALWWEKTYIPKVRQATTETRRFFNDRKWVSMFLKQMVEDGKLTKRPVLLNPDKKTKAWRYLENAHVKALIDNASGDLKQMIIMAATMGMRRLEITNLKWSGVDLKRKTISLAEEETKIRKARKFKISPDSLPWLAENRLNGSRFVFPNKFDNDRPVHKDGFMGSWKRLKKKLKIKARFHDLRHTFLTNAFKCSGSNPAFICHYAGLSLEEAQRTYLHFDENDTEIVSTLVSYG